MTKTCIICGKQFENKHNHQAVTCGPACFRIRQSDVTSERAKRRRAAKVWPKEPCVICGKLFDKKGQRLTCSKECGKKHAIKHESERMKHKRAENKKYIKCPVCGKEFAKTRCKKTCSPDCSLVYAARGDEEKKYFLSGNLCNPSSPDYFDVSMYKKKMKELKTPNGWKCRHCGCELTGDHRFYCSLCHTAITSKTSIRLDEGYMYYG